VPSSYIPESSPFAFPRRALFPRSAYLSIVPPPGGPSRILRGALTILRILLGEHLRSADYPLLLSCPPVLPHPSRFSKSMSSLAGIILCIDGIEGRGRGFLKTISSGSLYAPSLYSSYGFLSFPCVFSQRPLPASLGRLSSITFPSNLSLSHFSGLENLGGDLKKTSLPCWDSPSPSQPFFPTTPISKVRQLRGLPPLITRRFPLLMDF